MKKTILIIAVLAILTLGFLGCNGGNEGFVHVDPPTNLAITSTAGNINADDERVSLEVGTGITFTASATGSPTFTWEILDGEDYVTLSGETTVAATITAGAVQERTARIKVTARNAGGSIALEFYVDVIDSRILWVYGVESGSTIFIRNDSAGETFTAHTNWTGSLSFAWVADPAGVVNIANANTDTVTVTPVSDGTTTITVTLTRGSDIETFSFDVEVVEFLDIELRERNFAHPYQLTLAEVNTSLTYQMPSIGSSVEFSIRTLPDPGPAINSSTWVSSDTAIVSVFELSPTHAIVTAAGAGNATVTITAMAGGTPGVTSITFNVANVPFDYDDMRHVYASRLITNFVARDRSTHNNNNNQAPFDAGTVAGHPVGASGFTLGVHGTGTPPHHRFLWTVRPNLQEGRRVYTDRADRAFINPSTNPANQHFPAIPATLLGSTVIRGPAQRGAATHPTDNDGGDPPRAGTNRADLLSFRALTDIDVFLVVDSRIFPGGADISHVNDNRSWIAWFENDPLWVLDNNLFLLTGEGISGVVPNPPTGTPNTGGGGIMYVFRRSLNAGEDITLGGWFTSSVNMYTVLVRARGQ